MAAGFGSRLAPLTDHVPKPLLPVQAQPLLDRVVERMFAAGAQQLAVNSHHLGGMIADHLAAHPRAGRLTHFPEAEILGTGGALANARDFLGQTPAFMVHNGDVLCGADLAALMADHLRSGALATLLLVPCPRFDTVTLGEDGRVRHIAGCGQQPATRPGDRQLTYSGIAAFDRALLAKIAPGYSSLIAPLVAALGRDPGTVRGYVPPGGTFGGTSGGTIGGPAAGSWHDLGTLGSWLAVAGDTATTAAGFTLERLTGHGSDRRFWRLGQDDWSAIAMVSPPSDPEFSRFLAIAEFLGAPAILLVDEPAHAVLMADLGATQLYDLASGSQALPVTEYHKAVDAILALQALTPRAPRECPVAVDRCLDRAALRAETEYFQEQFLAGYCGQQDSSGLAKELTELATLVASFPVALIHRDFQSQNILVHAGEIRLVDFQGMRLGPLTYDLASLVWDPYVALPAELRADLVARFAAGCGGAVQASAGPSIGSMTVAAGLQRVMQALGAFAYLGQVKKKTGFLRHITAGVEHLRLLLADREAPPLPRLSAIMTRVSGLESDS